MLTSDVICSAQRGCASMVPPLTVPTANPGTVCPLPVVGAHMEAHSTDDHCNATHGCYNTPNDANSCELADPCLPAPLCSAGQCVSVTFNCTGNVTVNQCQDPICVSGQGCGVLNVTNRSCVPDDLCQENGMVSSPDGR